MRIKEAAAALGISADLIRRLERRGEIPRLRRDRAGQRRFTRSDVELIQRVIYPSHVGRPEAQP